MNKKILIVIFLILIFILVLSFLSKLKNPQLKNPPEVIITTDKTEYALGEAPIISIKNNLAGSTCLSLCYPYYWERNDGEWQGYSYSECEEFNSVIDCIKPNETRNLELSFKGYEFIDAPLPPGLYRIALPLCFNCQAGEDEAFREDQRFYSNEFIIGQ